MDVKSVYVEDSEKEWVKALSEGKKMTDVAEMSGLPVGTVAYKLNILRAKFNCKNTTELVATFVKHELI